jgi:hypothetical protein
MPEVVLCCDCKQPINKATDDYVVIEKATDKISGGAGTRSL